MDAIACISKARTQLAQAMRLSDVIEVRNSAEAIRTYIKSAGESLEAQNQAADLRLRAERRAGEMLAEMEKHPPGPDRSHAVTDLPPSLADLGISKMQSSRWQLAATLPEDEYNQLVERCTSIGKELTQSSLLAAARKRKNLLSPDQEEDEEYPIAELMELVGEVRMQIAKWISAFGPERLDVLAGVLRAEAVDMESPA